MPQATYGFKVGSERNRCLPSITASSACQLEYVLMVAAQQYSEPATRMPRIVRPKILSVTMTLA